jgi:hypothetical protein
MLALGMAQTAIGKASHEKYRHPNIHAPRLDAVGMRDTGGGGAGNGRAQVGIMVYLK